MQKLYLKDTNLYLIVLWLILTLINIDKAFHIDDTFYLEASKWVIEHPSRPMSGLINWHNNPEPIYKFNQPPLFFYLIGLVAKITGYSEIPLHLLLSIFTFLGLFFFIKICKIQQIPNEKYLLVLFAFNPAFIVNQNLMVDIPILALLLIVTFFLIKANKQNKLLNYCLSSLFLGIGLLIKYILLPVIIVLGLIMIVRRHFQYLVTLFIPVVILVLWSIWNYTEYGSVHLIDRPYNDLSLAQIKGSFLAFIVCLGGISSFSISLIYGLWPDKITKSIIFSIISLFIISVVVFVFGHINESNYSYYLKYCFFLNGLSISMIVLIHLINSLKKKGLTQFIESGSFIFFLLIISLGTFILLFSPFIATRHILLVIPFILLFGQKYINNAFAINKLTLTITVILGLLLGISDWKNADYYRSMAYNIDLPNHKTIWSAGHWGWQWYSKKNGMLQYSTNESKIKKGDYLVFPEDINLTELNNNLDLKLIDKKWKEADCLTLFSGGDYASLYFSTFARGPWCLSKDPIDTILVYNIENIKDNTPINNVSKKKAE